MKLINAVKDRFDCTIAAAAMVLETTPEYIIHAIGHDGMERLYPHLGVPRGRRGVHSQEIVDVGTLLGIALVQFDMKPIARHSDSVVRVVYNRHIDNVTSYKRNTLWLGMSDTGIGHAIAWNPVDDQFYDPRGYVDSEPRISLSAAWVAFRIEG